MDRRKLIKFGTNSYVISLPKDWVERNNLKKGGELMVEQQDAGLLVSPAGSAAQEKRAVITCDGKTADVIENQFTSYYKAGYTTIAFEGRELPKHAYRVKEIVHRFAGVEIVEQDLHRIVAKDLIDIKQVALPTIVTRMDMMVRSLLDDTLSDEHVHPDVLRERDRDINRLQFLAARVVRQVLDNPGLGSELGVTTIEVYYIDKVSWILERIGDYVKRINDDFERCAPKEQGAHKPELRKCYDHYLATMKAYHTRNTQQAAKLHDEVIHLIPEFTEKVLQTKHPCSLLALENMKNMLRDLRIILRVVIEMGGKD